MNIDDYQAQAQKTAIYPGQGDRTGVVYCALKLAGEAGEVAEKIGKALRGDYTMYGDETHNQIKKELGDVLWYVAMLAREYNLPLSLVAQHNLDKLAGRAAAGTLKGSGDER